MQNKDVQDRKGLRILFNEVKIKMKLVDEGIHILGSKNVPFFVIFYRLDLKLIVADR